MSALENQFSQICSRILEAKKETNGPWYAAFDADGTLWDTDLGEIFFDYQVHKCGLKLPADPWQYYVETKKVDAPKAYLWLAQINKGIPFAQVQHWAESAFVEKEPFPIFSFQKKLIQFLQKEQFKVFIVTASVKWAVEPGAKRLGIPASQVLGVKTEVKNGIVTDIQDGPITYRKGKADAILHATNGIDPIFCAGNTLGDLHLLESATHVAAAIISQKPGEALYPTEQELQSEAQKRHWLSLDLSNEY